MNAFNAIISTNSGSVKDGFYRDFVTYPVLNTGVGPEITITRNTSATYFNSYGLLKITDVNTPRFEYDFPRVNYVYNSSLCGVTLPYFIPYMLLGDQSATADNSNYNGKSNNFDISIREVGTENGLPYMDICLSGGPRGSNSFSRLLNAFQVTKDNPNGYSYFFSPTDKGNVFTVSSYVKIVSGSLPAGSRLLYFTHASNNPVGQNFVSVNHDLTNVTNQLKRYSASRIIENGNWTQMKPASAIVHVNCGLSLDSISSGFTFTDPLIVRIAGIQVEPGFIATDFIPTNGNAVFIPQPKGLLIEQRTTNIIPFSNTFSQWASGSGVNEVLAESCYSPEMSADGWTIFEKPTSSSVIHGLSTTFTLTNTTTGSYTFSIFLKSQTKVDGYSPSGGRRHAFLSFRGNVFGGEQTSIFQLTGAGFAYPLSGNHTSNIIYEGGGWYRCFINCNSTLAATDAVLFGMANSLYTYRYNGLDSSFGLFCYGAQLEASSSPVPTSYIPTNGSTVIRSRDDLMVSPISSFFNQKGGTIYAEGSTQTERNLPSLITFDDGTNGKRVQIRRNNTTACSFFSVISSNEVGDRIIFGPKGPPSDLMSISYPPSGGQYGYTWTGWNVGTDNRKIAAFYNNEEQVATQNGEPLTIYNKLTSIGCQPYSPTSPGGNYDLDAPETLTHMRLGGTASGGDLNGYLKKVRYIPYRLNDLLIKNITI